MPLVVKVEFKRWTGQRSRAHPHRPALSRRCGFWTCLVFLCRRETALLAHRVPEDTVPLQQGRSGATPVTQGTDGCGSVDSENAGPCVNGTKRPLCLIRRDIRRQPVLDGGAEGAGSSDPRRTRPHVCETEALTFHGRSPPCDSVQNLISSEPFAEQFPRSEKF